jgi:hypothetical protein
MDSNRREGREVRGRGVLMIGKEKNERKKKERVGSKNKVRVRRRRN